MSNFPLVSVITPNFNCYRFLPRLIECVRRQNFPLEHIVVDDCSTDGGWELLLELSRLHSWLKPVRLDKNSGPVVARNKAIELARGQFLAFLDVDDLWLSQKLNTQVQFMMENGCALSFTDYRFASEDGFKIGHRLRGFSQIGWRLHHMTRYLGCLTVIVDRNRVPDFFFPDLQTAKRAEDFLAWSQCINEHGPALRCPHDLARYSIVQNSRSSVTRSSVLSVWRLYRDVEGIALIPAGIYFLVFAFGVVWKRLRYRPFLDRGVVDADYEWSLLH
jgi:teichuronic acid biosynthesis glycosyltransferase TuaG